jgi:hypothetical protein
MLKHAIQGLVVAVLMMGILVPSGGLARGLAGEIEALLPSPQDSSSRMVPVDGATSLAGRAEGEVRPSPTAVFAMFAPMSVATPTDTPTNTPTAIRTPTNTPTNIPTNTPTTTPPPTNSPTTTLAPTNTPTATPETSPTMTPTSTPTNTPTNTAAPTNTPTSTNTPTTTPTLTLTDTPTPTPTSMPGPPQLFRPTDGAVLPQPVSPNEWYFSWHARGGPCYCSISIGGPGGRRLGDDHITPLEGYKYRYTTDEYLPDDALGPWRWGVSVSCPLGSNRSETRTFWVEPAPTPTSTPTPTITPVPACQVYLPLIMERR